MESEQQPLTIWILDDGKPGHRNQSLGLAEAIGRIRDTSVHFVSLPHDRSFFSRMKRASEQAKQLPKPDLVISAGHKTHVALLYLAWKTGARSVVLMKPSLPCKWFDHCLIPEHDFAEGVKTPENVMLSKGALNRIIYDQEAKDGSGLFLIGGKSSEFGFDGENLHKTIGEIVGKGGDAQWILTDSRRTAEGFIESLEGIPILVHPHQTTNSYWLPEQLRRASVVWVTEDSVSMIYEALTCGAQVGLLPMPRIKKAGRVARGIENLLQDKQIITYLNWQNGNQLPVNHVALAEADRCAELISEFV